MEIMRFKQCVYTNVVYITDGGDTHLAVEEAVKDCDHKALNGKKNTDKRPITVRVMVKFPVKSVYLTFTAIC